MKKIFESNDGVAIYTIENKIELDKYIDDYGVFNENQFLADMKYVNDAEYVYSATNADVNVVVLKRKITA